MKNLLGSFGSDNFSGVSKEVMLQLQAANHGHVPSYGNDPFTHEAIDLFKHEFGKNIEVFMMLNGTGANVAALKSITSPIHSIICAESAHIQTQETGAVYAHTGCKLLLIPSADGKISAKAALDCLEKELYWRSHSTLPKVVSITQSTEYGTIYTLDEMKEISKMCKEHRLLLHVDGCRIYNAAVALNCSLKAISEEVGVDVMSVGGTKNGLMFAEALVFFNKELAKNFSYFQKQSLQLASKMRYISAQYLPFFKQKIWKKNAEHSNAMAKKLSDGIRKIPGIEFSQKVETNQLFLRLPKQAIEMLKKHFLFHVWNERQNEIRLITSFDTKIEEVESFLEHLEASMKKE